MTCDINKKNHIKKNEKISFFMQGSLNQVDLVSILSKSRKLNPRFTAREAWMRIHEARPGADVYKFSEILKSLSADKTVNSNADEPDNSKQITPIFSYETDQRGIRYFSFSIKQEHYTISDITSKIKEVMCHASQDQHFSMNAEISCTIFSESQNEFMTEMEIADRTGISIKRIRPVLTILVDLGVVIIENSEITLDDIFNCTNHEPKCKTRNRFKWDENREARRQNLCDWLQYLNRLRKMEKELLESI